MRSALIGADAPPCLPPGSSPGPAARAGPTTPGRDRPRPRDGRGARLPTRRRPGRPTAGGRGRLHRLAGPEQPHERVVASRGAERRGGAAVGQQVAEAPAGPVLAPQAHGRHASVRRVQLCAERDHLREAAQVARREQLRLALGHAGVVQPGAVGADVGEPRAALPEADDRVAAGDAAALVVVERDRLDPPVRGRAAAAPQAALRPANRRHLQVDAAGALQRQHGAERRVRRPRVRPA